LSNSNTHGNDLIIFVTTKANGSLKTCSMNHLGYNISGMDNHPWSPMDYKAYGDGCVIIISKAVFDGDIRHGLCPISSLNQIIFF
jgi:hypothetical protein